MLPGTIGGRGTATHIAVLGGNRTTPRLPLQGKASWGSGWLWDSLQGLAALRLGGLASSVRVLCFNAQGVFSRLPARAVPVPFRQELVSRHRVHVNHARAQGVFPPPRCAGAVLPRHRNGNTSWLVIAFARSRRCAFAVPAELAITRLAASFPFNACSVSAAAAHKGCGHRRSACRKVLETAANTSGKVP